MRRPNFSLPTPAFAAAICSLALIFTTLHLLSWRSIPQKVGLGDIFEYGGAEAETTSEQSTTTAAAAAATAATAAANVYFAPNGSPAPPFNTSSFIPGVPKPNGAHYSKTLVIAQLKEDNTTWATSPEMQRHGWSVAAYVVNDRNAELRPPKNKGHEAMVYLSYIIDNYDTLPDIAAFMHAHQFAWHNEEIFDFDAVEMLSRLSLEHVVREGYFNMRCEWYPGCPSWIHVSSAIDEDRAKKEEWLIARAWAEIFPDRPVPKVLSQPCCAQFVLSRDRIRAIPRERFIYYREWLLQTELRDAMSGRVWEYLWHVVFTGKETSCPTANVCLCDGFGVCFGGDDKVQYYYDTLHRIKKATSELSRWQDSAWGVVDEDARIAMSLDEMGDAEPAPDDSEGLLLTVEVEEKTAELAKLKQRAIEKGADPVYRAWSAGRVWKVGDGY